MTEKSVPPNIYFPNASNFQMHQPQFINTVHSNVYSDQSIIKQKLQAELQPLNGACLNPHKTCLKGTRVGIIAEISRWIYSADEQVPAAFFLCGEAGTGKSTIIHTIGQQAEDKKCLGAFFCFDRAFVADRTPCKALQTIAYDLSISFPEFGQGLAEALDAEPNIPTRMSLKKQWSKLIVTPAKLICSNRPHVIIIDAFDECGSKEIDGQRDMLLSLLINNVCELPQSFRVLVTSRMEVDVQRAVKEGSNAHLLQVQYMRNLQNTQDDIHRYVAHRMMKGKDSLGVLNEYQCQMLAEKSQGFFQWAYTTCEALGGRGKAGLTIKKRFDRFMSLSPSHGHDLLPLDRLYKSILEDIFDCGDKEAMSQYRKVMSQILAAVDPLSSASLHNIQLASGEDDDQIDVVTPFLGSLLTGIDQNSVPIKPVHTSVRDFLLDPARSAEYAVDIYEGHNSLAICSLRLLTTKLHFNMCDFESSYLLNSQVENLAEKITQKLSPELIYASCFWNVHVSQARQHDAVLPLLEFFLYKFLLYWMEVLSLCDKLHTVPETVGEILDWLEQGLPCSNIKSGDDLKSILKELRNFVRVFGKMIAESTPHLYLSALPFIPKASRLQQLFTPEKQKLAVICHGHEHHWSNQQAVLVGHSGSVYSVAFSPNGEKILSGCDDHSARIWDAETGAVNRQPLTKISTSLLPGHEPLIMSVAFSADVKRIAFGYFSPNEKRTLGPVSSDHAIAIWDTDTGTVLQQIFTGDSGTVDSIAFSPDAKMIVSGSRDHSVCIWNTETGALDKKSTAHSHMVYSVAFSPDGKRVVSGAINGELMIWDGKISLVVTPPMRDRFHIDPVYCVAFSPDGKSIVSGHRDGSICIWDAETLTLVEQPLTSHSEAVLSVAFSPDGRKIASGSYDQSVNIWSTKTETRTTCKLKLTGHLGIVYSVVFSPDGTRVASGSQDCSVRIWETETEITAEQPFIDGLDSLSSTIVYPEGKINICGPSENSKIGALASSGRLYAGLYPVELSPDGKSIVSRSQAKLICLWNAKNGTLLWSSESSDYVDSLAWSPDGKKIAASSRCSVSIWDSKTGALIIHSSTEQLQISSIAFSPDGKMILLYQSNHSMWFWNAETEVMVGEPMLLGPEVTLGPKTFMMRAVAFSPDKQNIVIGYHSFSTKDEALRPDWNDHKIAIYNVRTATVRQLFTGNLGDVYSIAFSPDGKMIASGGSDHLVCIWNAESGILSKKLIGQSSRVCSVAFSHNGKRVVSGFEDGSVCIWDRSITTAALQLTGHLAPVFSVAFFPDGKKIVSASHDCSVRIWNVDMEANQHTVPTILPDKGYSQSFCPWNNAHCIHHTHASFQNIHLTTEGWLCGSDNSLFLWIPPDYRPALMFPRTKLLISQATSVSLDLSRLVDGKDWAQCIEEHSTT